MPANRPRRPQEPEQNSTTPSKGRLNNLELAGIGLLCFAILLYGISRCNRQPEPPEPTLPPTVTEEVVDSTMPASTPAASSTAAPRRLIADSTYTPRKLYVLADSLRLRESPELSGKVLGYLNYGEEVLDLGEQTDLQRLRVSVDEVRTAPWIKIKSEKGVIGWTFGAYLQFYPVPRVSSTMEQPTDQGQ